MDNSKVVITAYYISVLGQMMEEKWEQDELASAKAYVEQNMPAINRPKYNMSATQKEEDDKQYDVTRLTIFNFSHLDIVDYTEGHKIEKEIENNNNNQK
jgi:hypothetical protein